MCFNARVSTLTYITGLLGSYLLYKNNQISLAIFYAWVIQMQLIELIFHVNGKCNDLNLNTTKLGIFLNHTQPIVLWLSIYYFSSMKLPSFVNYALVIYTIWAVIHSYATFNPGCTEVTQESYPHLHWKWNSGRHSMAFYTYFLICFVILSLYGLNNGVLHSCVVTIGLLISYYIYEDKHIVGSFWCLAASFAPLIMVNFS